MVGQPSCSRRELHEKGPRTFLEFVDPEKNEWFTAIHRFGLRLVLRERGLRVGEPAGIMAKSYAELNSSIAGRITKIHNKNWAACHLLPKDLTNIQIFLYISPPRMSPEQRGDAERNVTN